MLTGCFSLASSSSSSSTKRSGTGSSGDVGETSLSMRPIWACTDAVQHAFRLGGASRRLAAHASYGGPWCDVCAMHEMQLAAVRAVDDTKVSVSVLGCDGFACCCHMLVTLHRCVALRSCHAPQPSYFAITFALRCR